MNKENRIPIMFKEDIDKAIQILKESGCYEIYLFGSIARGDYREDSDIDLAVKGLLSEDYFKICGKIMIEIKRNIDIIQLDDEKSDFAKHINRKGYLIRVA